MPITNLLGAESLIKDLLDPMFKIDMVFVEANAEEINQELFEAIDYDGDKVAAVILNGGYQTDPPVGQGRTQRIKTLWQVAIVCPKNLRDIGGTKAIEVFKTLSGQRLSGEFDYMKAVSDERGFNRPDYVIDLVYIPMMFSVGTVI